MPHRRAVDLRCRGLGFVLRTELGLTGERQDLAADIVIFATGFRPQLPACVAPIAARFERGPDGELVLGRHFEARWDGPAGHRVYAINAGRHSHGIAEPQLSLMAWRSAVILNHVAGRRVFDVEDSAGPIAWQAPIEPCAPRTAAG